MVGERGEVRRAKAMDYNGPMQAPAVAQACRGPVFIWNINILKKPMRPDTKMCPLALAYC